MSPLIALLLYQLCFYKSLAADSCSKNIVLSDEMHGKALVNHTFQTVSVIDNDVCQLYCFMDDRCISYNFYQQLEICNLSSSDHIMHPGHLVKRPNALYYRVKNNCDCISGNVASCTVKGGTHQCHCKPGFTGNQCETDIDDCVNSPCQNQGTCKDLVNGYSCVCTEDFKGENCSINRVSWFNVTSKPVRIGVKDDNYASFTIPTNCAIFRFKLIYDSGPGVSYLSSNADIWGTKGWLMIHITDDNKRRITPPKEYIKNTKKTHLGYKIDGVTSSDPELPFPEMSPPLSVTAGQEYRAWFGQDLANIVERNNVGYVCVNVTILARV